MKLNEKEMKCLLLDFLAEHYPAKLIGVEVPFLSGNRWADVILLSKSSQLVAFEIKSDFDSLRRLARQIDDYIKTFNRVYVVLSRKFRGAVKILPRSVGVLLVGDSEKNVVLLREARPRVRLSKKNLSYFLWKKSLSAHARSHRDTADILRKRMLRASSLKEIRTAALNAIAHRYEERYRVFLRQKSARVQIEDLDFLTRSSWDIS